MLLSFLRLSCAPAPSRPPVDSVTQMEEGQLYKESESKGGFSQNPLEREICHNNKLSNYDDVLSYLVSGISNSLLFTVEWSHMSLGLDSDHWLLPYWCSERPEALPLSDVWLSSELRLAF